MKRNGRFPPAFVWYVDSGGSGVPIVFLHAATGSSRVWEHQIPAFTAAGYRFIATIDADSAARSSIRPAHNRAPRPTICRH